MNTYASLSLTDLQHDIAVIPPLGTVRVGYLWGLDELIRQHGRDPQRIFAQRGLDSQLFDNPDNTIDCMSIVDLLEYCGEELGDPLFGLHLAAKQDPKVFGCVVSLAQAASSFREALHCLTQYIPVSASPECELELVHANADVMELRWRTHIGFGDEVHTNYHGLFIVFKTLSAIGQQNFVPMYAKLKCTVAKSDTDALKSQLGCQVHGKSDYNAIGFSTRHLDCALPSTDRLLFTILHQGLSQIRGAANADYVEKVRASIRRELSSGFCSVESCAQFLGTSTRTLQKRLHRKAIKFSDLVREERIKLAKHALVHTNLSLDEIAFQLGYSEQTSFGRAFKLATGLTPKSFRASNRAAH